MSAPEEAGTLESVAAAAARLPAGRRWTERAAARWERGEVARLLDERLSFDDYGSLTERARLRAQVLAELARSRPERVEAARPRARGRGWSL